MFARPLFTVAPYLQESDEEEEGVGRPPELGVEEAGEEGEEVVFGRAAGPGSGGEGRRQRKRKQTKRKPKTC